MAIDLPPVMPPQLASSAQIAEAEQGTSSSKVEVTVGGIRLQVIGNRYLSNADLRELLLAEATPSAAITALARRYYNTGHFLVGLHYFRRGDTVVVMVSQHTLKGVRGDPAVRRHFRSLVGDPDLTLAEYDRARVLADMQAQRMGVSYRVSYEVHYDKQVILDFIAEPVADHQPSSGAIEVNNQGSRYLGRYFGLAGLSHEFGDGSKLNLGYQTAFVDLGGAQDGESYHQLDARVDRPFHFGLFGLDINHVRYEREPVVAEEDPTAGGCVLFFCLPGTVFVPVPLEAEITRLGVDGEQLLSSTPRRRISVFEGIDYVDSEIVGDTKASRSEVLLEERYAVASVGAKYAARGRLGQRPDFLTAQLALKVGVGGNDGTLRDRGSSEVSITNRNADFVLLQPRLAYKFDLTPAWTTTFNLHGQLSNDVQLPQQQQFVLGGLGSLSAYLPGALVGDQGVFFHIGVQRRWQFETLSLTPSVFVEYGAARYNDTDDDLGDSQTISDAGIRVTVIPAGDSGLESELVVARGLSDDVADPARLDAFEADFFWRVRWSF